MRKPHSTAGLALHQLNKYPHMCWQGTAFSDMFILVSLCVPKHSIRFAAGCTALRRPPARERRGPVPGRAAECGAAGSKTDASGIQHAALWLRPRRLPPLRRRRKWARAGRPATRHRLPRSCCPISAPKHTARALPVVLLIIEPNDGQIGGVENTCLLPAPGRDSTPDQEASGNKPRAAARKAVLILT